MSLPTASEYALRLANGAKLQDLLDEYREAVLRENLATGHPSDGEGGGVQ